MMFPASTGGIQQAAAPVASGGLGGLIPSCITSVMSGNKSWITRLVTVLVIVVVGWLVWRWWKNRSVTSKKLSVQERVSRLEYMVAQMMNGMNEAMPVHHQSYAHGPQMMEDHSRMNMMMQQQQQQQIASRNLNSSNILRKIHVDPMDKDKVTMPTSGRFYDSNEFHAVGYISQVRLGPGQQDPAMPEGLPSTLPLYGQRVDQGTIRGSRWQYMTVFNNSQYNIVRVKSLQPFVLEDCANGCDELDPSNSMGDILVVVPTLAGGTPWKVKLYSRI